MLSRNLNGCDFFKSHFSFSYNVFRSRYDGSVFVSILSFLKYIYSMNQLTQLIPIRERDGAQTVSARDLHKFLGVETPYKLWHKRMFEYGFEENVDFVAVVQKSTTAQGNEYSFTDHALTLDTAKEIAMLQRYIFSDC